MVFSSYIFLKKTDISATCRWETNSKAKCSPQHPDCRDRLPKLVASHPVHLDHSLLTFSSPVPFCCYLHNDDENSCRLPCVCDLEPGTPAPMGDRIWITDTYRQGPSHPRRRSCSSSACHASLAHCLLYADKGLELADSNSAATQLAIPCQLLPLCFDASEFWFAGLCKAFSLTMIRIPIFRGCWSHQVINPVACVASFIP